MKKVIFSLAAIAMAAGMFTGCSKKNQNSSSAAGTVKLEMYYYKQENQEGLKRIVKAFEKQNPGVTIDMLIIPNDADSAMSARAAQGDLPDILQMQSYSRIKEYASKGFLLDLSKEEAMGKVLPSSLPENSMQFQWIMQESVLSTTKIFLISMESKLQQLTVNLSRLAAL